MALPSPSIPLRSSRNTFVRIEHCCRKSSLKPSISVPKFFPKSANSFLIAFYSASDISSILLERCIVWKIFLLMMLKLEMAYTSLWLVGLLLRLLYPWPVSSMPSSKLAFL